MVADTCDALIEMNGAATPTSEATCLTTSDEASPITSGEPCWIRPATWSIAALGVSEVTPLTDKSPPKVLTNSCAPLWTSTTWSEVTAPPMRSTAGLAPLIWAPPPISPRMLANPLSAPPISSTIGPNVVSVPPHCVTIASPKDGWNVTPLARSSPPRVETVPLIDPTLPDSPRP